MLDYRWHWSRDWIFGTFISQKSKNQHLIWNIFIHYYNIYSLCSNLKNPGLKYRRNRLTNLMRSEPGMVHVYVLYISLFPFVFSDSSWHTYLQSHHFPFSKCLIHSSCVQLACAGIKDLKLNTAASHCGSLHCSAWWETPTPLAQKSESKICIPTVLDRFIWEKQSIFNYFQIRSTAA